MPPPLNSELTRVQIGLESTAGTLVAATRRIPFNLGSGAYTPTYDRKTLEEVRGVLADYDDVLAGKSSQLQITQELDFEHLIAALECGFVNVTAVGADPSVWTFTPGVTAIPVQATATIEVGLTNGAANYYARFGNARPTAITISADATGSNTAELQTTWMGGAEVALVAPAVVSSIARTPIPARLFKCYIDDDYASLGSTAFAPLRSFTASYVPNNDPAYLLQGRPNLDQAGWYKGKLQGQLSLVVDHDSDGSGELVAWKAGTLRFIRLEATLGSGTALRKLTLDHAVRYIESPDVLSVDGNQHTLQLTGHLRADVQASVTNIFSVVISNGVTAW